MIETHPLVVCPPHAALWRRSDRRAQAFRPSVHAELVVLFGRRGSAQYYIDGQVVTLGAGSLLFAWAGAAHFLVSDRPEFDMWVALVSGRFAAGLAGVPSVSGDGAAGVRQLSADAADELDGLARKVRAMPEALAPGLGWWLIRAWHHWQAAPEGAGRALHPAVDRAARSLRRSPDMALADLARGSGLSPGRLGQVFRREMGQGLVAFRTGEKLARADQLIRIGRLDLLNAALEAGFGSYSQFYRAFVARYGVSPRAYYRGHPGHT
ncbi:MAG: AraC family transcriptional regulator [Pseudomonadota bacterium]